MKVLVIGAGRMGAIRVEDLVADKRVTQVLIANRNEDRAKELAASFGADPLPWSEIENVEVDAAVVAVGTAAHQEVLQMVAPKAIPILCEKPIAPTVAGTEEAIELVAKHGSEMQIGFQRRFDEPIKKIQQQASSGELGILYCLSLTAHDMTPSEREFMAGSGGIFRDMHVHDFDVVRWITGSEVESVYATKAVRYHMDYVEFDDADVTAITLRTVSGVQAVITGTRHGALGQDVRVEVFGSKNAVSAGLNTRTPINDLDGQLGLNTNPYIGFVDRFRDAFKNETGSFISFARGEIENPCPSDSALESLRIAVACEQSIATGSAVMVKDIS
jgi:myo-inositol 2-dehydrogenase/D-chiro-inositol 1-dehydrogenase